MTPYSRGDVVLVAFVFSDDSGRKLRPVLVVSSPDYHRARREIIVAAITSNIHRRLFGDWLLVDWRFAGLLYPSIVTGIVRTVSRSVVERKLGTVSKTDLKAVESELRRSLSL